MSVFANLITAFPLQAGGADEVEAIKARLIGKIEEIQAKSKSELKRKFEFFVRAANSVPKKPSDTADQLRYEVVALASELLDLFNDTLEGYYSFVRNGILPKDFVNKLLNLEKLLLKVLDNKFDAFKEEAKACKSPGDIIQLAEKIKKFKARFLEIMREERRLSSHGARYQGDQKTSPETKNIIAQAKAEVLRGDFKPANEKLNNILFNRPLSKEDRSGISKLISRLMVVTVAEDFVKMGKLPLAIETYEKVKDLSPAIARRIDELKKKIKETETSKPAAPAPAQPEETKVDLEAARDYFEKGSQSFQKGDYKNAIVYFVKAYKITKDPLLFYNIAQSYWRLGQKMDAMMGFDAYLRGVPDAEDREEVKNMIGILEKDEAVILAKQAMAYMRAAEQSTDPKKRDLHYRSALVVFSAMDESTRNGPAILFRMGICYHSISDFKHALEYYQRIDRSISEHRQYDTEIAIKHCELGFSSEEKAKEAALKLMDEANALLKKGKYEAAINKCLEARDLAPKNVLIHLKLGYVLRMAKRFDQAAQAYEKALALKPQDVELLFTIGTCKQKAGDHKAAVEFFKRAAAVENISKVQYALYESYAKMHDVANALEAYSKASKLYPVDYPPKTTAQSLSDINILYSEALAAANKKEEALAAAKAAVEHDPNSARAHLNLGRRNLDLENYKTAIANFTQVIKLKSTTKEEKVAAYEGRSRANQGLARNYAGSKNLLKKVLYKQYSAAAEADSKKASELGFESAPAPAPTPKRVQAPKPEPEPKPKIAMVTPPPAEKKTSDENKRTLSQVHNMIAAKGNPEAATLMLQEINKEELSKADAEKFKSLTVQLNTLLRQKTQSEIEKGKFAAARAALQSVRTEVLSAADRETHGRLLPALKEISQAEELEKNGKFSEARAIYLKHVELNRKEILERVVRLEEKIQKQEDKARKEEKIISDKIVPRSEKENGLSRSVFLSAAQKHRSSLKPIHTRALKSDKSLVGEVVFGIEVNADGSVSKIGVLENKSKIKADFINQVIFVMKSWRFPSAEKPSVYGLPYQFKPDDDETVPAKSSEENSKHLKACQSAIKHKKGRLTEAESNLLVIKPEELNAGDRVLFENLKKDVERWKKAKDLEDRGLWIEAKAAYQEPALYKMNPKYFEDKIKELDKKIAKMPEEQKQNALPYLEEAVKKDPKNPVLWNKLGWARIKNKKYREAVLAFKENTGEPDGLDKYNPDNYYGTAIARYHLNECGPAKDAFNQAKKWDASASYKNKPQPWLQNPCK